jgi:sterol desaturase/sphingolipid hydroxylase (fatty acid hydroxylase superfamily)
MLLDMIGVFAATAVVFFIAERLEPARHQPIFRRGFLTDGVYCVTSVGIRILVNGTLAIAISDAGARLAPGYAVGVLRDEPLWVQAVAILFALDVVFYVMHRLKHNWGWLWRLHETHHSSEDLDWFSSVRFHPLEKLLDRTIYLFPLLFLGVSDAALLILAAVDAAIASFSHSNLNWRIGPLIYVFVGPEMHRWHHAKDPRFQNCNFGNNLSIFDWMFGTAYIGGENPTEFGLRDQGYPEGNFFKQFLYAFRPARPASSVRAAAPAPAAVGASPP